MPAAKQLPVTVTLTSQITYPEDEDTLKLQAPGTVTWLHDQLYLRFTEDTILEGQSFQTKVMLKFEQDGSVQMRRTSPTSSSQMHFIKGRPNQTHYQTPAGMLLLSIETQALKSQVSPQKPDQGQLDLSYSLTQNELVVGHYHIHLTFKPS